MLPASAHGTAGRVADRLAERLGLAGLGLFAFGYVGGRALANIGLGLLLLAFAATCAGDWRRVAADRLVRLGLVWIGVVTLLAVRGAALYPDVAAHQYQSLVELWSFAFVPLVAAATRGRTTRVVATLLAALAGVLYKLARDVVLGVGPPDHYDDLALGVGRNLAVLFIDVGAVGCVLMLFALFEAPHWSRARRGAAGLASATALAALLLAWAAATSRTSLAVLPLVLAGVLAGRLLGDRRVLGLGLVLGLILLAVAALNKERIMLEAFKDGSTWAAIAAGDPAAVPRDTATGLRFHMWHLAWENWRQHPLLGVGPSVSHLFERDPSRSFLAIYNQYHSGYVELLLRSGLVGAGFYLAAAWLVWRTALQAVRAGRMPRALFELLMAGFAIFAALNFTNSILFFQQGWQFIVLFGGLARGYAWAAPPPPAGENP